MSENAAKKTRKPSFFKGVKAEFKKITWPDKTSLLKQTVAVISVSVVVGVVIAIMDFFIQYGVNILLSL
ncbi:MAG: preprotein translocase subunit SecE [Lachnospiraceae bacterium]|nr:preprotein translocase subunit SecE [Lachnospiraceae bacterium]